MPGDKSSIWWILVDITCFWPQYKWAARKHISLHLLGECGFVPMTCHRWTYINTLSEVSGLCFWLSYHHWIKLVVVHYGARSIAGSFLTRTSVLRFVGLQSWQHAWTAATTQVIFAFIGNVFVFKLWISLPSLWTFPHRMLIICWG